MNIEDVIIVGAGPAGISCAIQLKRYGINPIILEHNQIGGLAINANKIENYLGFPEGISGQEFVNLLKKHLENYRIEIHYEKVIDVNYKNFVFEIKTENNHYTALTLVLATGTKEKKIENIEYDEKLSHKIHYDITKLLNSKGRTIAIIGAGDAAFDYALSLANNDNKVYIFNRTDKLKCLPLLNDRCDKHPNVKYIPNAVLTHISEKFKNLLLIFTIDNHTKIFEFDFLVFAIGREINMDYINDKFHQQFNDLRASKRLFTIGDINHKNYRQISIAVGEGIKTAMEIFDELKY